MLLVGEVHFGCSVASSKSLSLRKIKKLIIKYIDSISQQVVDELIAVFKNFQNILIIFSVNKILAPLYKASTTLQTSTIPIFDIMPILKSVKNSLSELNIGSGHFQTLMSEANDFGTAVNTNLRIETEHQFMIEEHSDPNTVHDTIHNFVCSLSTNFHQRFFDDLKNRETQMFYEELESLHPRKVIQIDGESEISLRILCHVTNVCQSRTVAEMRELAVAIKIYIDENAGNQNTEEILISNPWETLRDYFSNSTTRDQFPNVHKIYQHIFALPSSQVDCERCFSTMANIKSSLRASMSDEMLDCCVVLQLARDLMSASAHGKIIDLIASQNKKLKKYLQVTE